jgi:tetratricopeptide (TPR) repeat protein
MNEIPKNYLKTLDSFKDSWDYDSALQYAQKLLIDYGDDYRVYEEIADIYLFQQDFIHAERALEFSRKIAPESPTWLYLYWFLLLAQNKYREALPVLEKANTLFPNNAEVLRNLWWANVMNNSPERGIFLLRRALNLAPSDEMIIEDLGVTLLGEWFTDEWEKLLRSIWKEQRILELRTLSKYK